ncbi:ATP-binding protein, partial [Streptomyces sp. DT225]
MTAAQEVPEDNPPLHDDLLDYTPTARSVTLARRRAARLVGEWGHADRAGEVALLVSELATNALIHGSLRGRLFRVHLILTGGAIRIEVSDPRGERLPGLREAERDEC